MAEGRVLIVYDEAVDKGSRWIRFAKGGHFHSNSKGPTFNINLPINPDPRPTSLTRGSRKPAKNHP